MNIFWKKTIIILKTIAITGKILYNIYANIKYTLRVGVFPLLCYEKEKNSDQYRK